MPSQIDSICAPLWDISERRFWMTVCEKWQGWETPTAGKEISEFLTELHGGSVVARSGGLGKGSSFIIPFPIATALNEHKVEVPSQSNETMLADLTGLKVISLDDDINSVEIVKRILTSRHAEVHAVSSVAEARELMRTFSADVILSDIGTPGQDGYEFVRMLRDHPFSASVPAAALTALARAENRTAALNAGFETHITRPVPQPSSWRSFEAWANFVKARQSPLGINPDYGQKVSLHFKRWRILRPRFGLVVKPGG